MRRVWFVLGVAVASVSLSLGQDEGPEGKAVPQINVSKMVNPPVGAIAALVMDAQTGKMIAQLPIGDRCDGVAFDPGKKRAYSSNGEGTMTVVQQENKDSYNVLENFPTQNGARTIALDKRTGSLYLPAAEFVAQDPASKQRPAVKPNSFFVLEIQCLK